MNQPFTKEQVSALSDADITMAISSVIAIARDQLLTDEDVHNFWLLYQEQAERHKAHLLRESLQSA